ncbi:hypothetical protein HGB07_06600 [Candidatus Roizmanbacteria bacterium]|nr:hypothetical protein [Candidatus Roizmanbacteria bacterium]
MKHIVLISCVSKKLSYSAKAKDIYISPLFKYNLKYAEKMAPDMIAVLSAKYGLLSLDQVIDPYEQTLNTMSVSEVKNWSAKVCDQLSVVCSLRDTEFTFLAGEKYRKYLLPNLSHYIIPFKGLSIGKQLQNLKLLTAG